MSIEIVHTTMEGPNIQRWKLEDAADTLAYQEGVDAAKAELERIAQQLDE